MRRVYQLHHSELIIIKTKDKDDSKDMQKLIDKFHSEYKSSELKIAQVSILTIHILICVFFWQAYKNDLIIKGILKAEMMYYFFITPFLLLFGYYRQLRNFKVYILWLIVGIGQFIFYRFTNNNPDFRVFFGANLTSFIALLSMLITFQFLRQLYMFLSHKELIITFGKFSWFDKHDKRKMTWLDVLFSFIIILVTTLSCLF